MVSASSSAYENKDDQVDKCLVHKPSWLDAFLGEAFPRSCAAHRLHKKELIKYCINCNLSYCRHCVLSASHRHHEVLNIYKHNHKAVVSRSGMEKHIDCSEIQTYNKNKRTVVISLNPQRKRGLASDVEASCNTCSRKLTDHKFRYCSISCKVNTVLRNTDEDPASIPTASPPQEGQVEEKQVNTVLMNTDEDPASIPAESPPQEGQVEEMQVNTVLRNTDEDPASIPTESPPQEGQVEEMQVEISEPPKLAEEIQEKPANPLSFRKRPRKGIPHRAPFF